MANTTAAAFATRVPTTKEELRRWVPVFNSYQNEEDQENYSAYFGDFQTTAVISTGSVTFPSAPVPSAVNKYGNPFNYSNSPLFASTRPLVRRGSALPARVNATGAASGVSWTGQFPLFSIDALTDYLGIVVQTDTPATNITLRVGTTSSAYYEFTFTASSANTYEFLTAVFSSASVTGSPGLTGLGNFVAVLGAGACNITVHKLSTANNQDGFVGSIQTIRHDCLVDQQLEATLETADIKCFQYIERKVKTGGAFKIMTKSNQTSMKTEAQSYAETMKRGTVTYRRILNSASEGLKSVISAGGTLTTNLQTGLNINQFSQVVIQSGPAAGAVLNRVYSASAVTDTSFFYNTSTGAVTFSTVHAGQYPLIEVVFTTTGNYFTAQNLKTGAVGNLMLQRDLADGPTQIKTFFVAELAEVKFNQTDGNVEQETTYNVYPMSVGANRVWFTSSEI
jgi:hypothetical protein